jgi:hypothetical protein
MRRRLAVNALGLLLLGAVAGAGWAAGPTYDLNGAWTDKAGTTSLTLQQSGNTLTWQGGPNNRAWIQSFRGTLGGSTFSGTFVQDAPGVSPQRYHGTMTARVIDSCHFVFTSIVQAGMPTVSGIEFVKNPCTTVPAPVPIATVSNGCGGGDWKLLVKFQNFLANTSTYYDVPNGTANLMAHQWSVSFKDACDLHDAGYAGAVVRDKLRGGIKDFRRWTRKQVDDKFLADMRFLCERQIAKDETIVLDKCRGHGGDASIGAESRYDFVREHGAAFFDADLDRPGTQKTGPRANN